MILGYNNIFMFTVFFISFAVIIIIPTIWFSEEMIPEDIGYLALILFVGAFLFAIYVLFVCIKNFRIVYVKKDSIIVFMLWKWQKKVVLFSDIISVLWSCNMYDLGEVGIEYRKASIFLDKNELLTLSDLEFGNLTKLTKRLPNQNKYFKKQVFTEHAKTKIVANQISIVLLIIACLFFHPYKICCPTPIESCDLSDNCLFRLFIFIAFIGLIIRSSIRLCIFKGMKKRYSK